MSTKKGAGRLVLKARAPTRIDLAGGTIDIWPLFLLIPRAQTLNVGIDLFAEATLEINKSPEVILRSDDQRAELEVSWADLASANVPAGLRIHQRLLLHYGERLKKKPGLTLKTKAMSPAGAGLGGSSALNIALTGVLSAWVSKRRGDKHRPEDLIDVSRDIETGILKGPAGLQDYYGATFGGLQSIRWGVARHERSAFSDKVRRGLEKRLLLFYSGQSRNSGINNWALFKGYLDENLEIQKKFELIALATEQLAQALAKEDWAGVGVAIQKEWQIRKTLAAGISTPGIDRAIETAQGLGATAAKVCGAGGGGCFFVYTPDAGSRKGITQKLVEQGMTALSISTVAKGLTVTHG